MPLYEYECDACHRRIEKIQKFADAPLTVCPHCQGRLERTITAPAFQFAGGGWYKDGYGNAKPAAATGDAATPAAAAAPAPAPAAAPAASASTTPTATPSAPKP